MNKNKYYTPKIEEFFVGFEFETNYLSDVWESRVLSSSEADYFFNTYYADAVATEFRVKYLDKEDLENLGFIKTKEDTFEKYSTSKYAAWVLYVYDNKISITFYHPDDSKGELWFFGTIKNKSELKKLLTQLGIS